MWGTPPCTTSKQDTSGLRWGGSSSIVPAPVTAGTCPPAPPTQPRCSLAGCRVLVVAAGFPCLAGGAGGVSRWCVGSLVYDVGGPWCWLGGWHRCAQVLRWGPQCWGMSENPLQGWDRGTRGAGDRAEAGLRVGQGQGNPQGWDKGTCGAATGSSVGLGTGPPVGQGQSHLQGWGQGHRCLSPTAEAGAPQPG